MSFVLWHCLTTADSREISWDFIFAAMPTMAANWCRRLNLLRHWPQIRQGVVWLPQPLFSEDRRGTTMEQLFGDFKGAPCREPHEHS